MFLAAKSASRHVELIAKDLQKKNKHPSKQRRAKRRGSNSEQSVQSVPTTTTSRKSHTILRSQLILGQQGSMLQLFRKFTSSSTASIDTNLSDDWDLSNEELTTPVTKSDALEGILTLIKSQEEELQALVENEPGTKALARCESTSQSVMISLAYRVFLNAHASYRRLVMICHQLNDLLQEVQELECDDFGEWTIRARHIVEETTVDFDERTDAELVQDFKEGRLWEEIKDLKVDYKNNKNNVGDCWVRECSDWHAVD